jgi:hypothetical protein
MKLRTLRDRLYDSATFWAVMIFASSFGLAAVYSWRVAQL